MTYKELAKIVADIPEEHQNDDVVVFLNQNHPYLIVEHYEEPLG